MSKHLSTTILVLFSSFLAVPVAQAQTHHAVNVAIGEPGSDSFVFGTELWTMGQVALKPQHGIDLSVIRVADEGERLALLREAEIEIALVGGDVPTSHASHMRTIMALWPKGNFTSERKPAQILARKDVSNDVIYRITKAVFENPNFFENTTGTKFGVADRYHATVGTDLPIHPGASRYYNEERADFHSRPIGPATRMKAEADNSGHKHPASFVHFDDTALSREERSQVAAACRQALELGALSAVLGDLSSRGCEVYQSYMEDQENDPHQKAATGDDLFALPAGQGGPAILLDHVAIPDQAPTIVQGDHRLKANPRRPTM